MNHGVVEVPDHSMAKDGVVSLTDMAGMDLNVQWLRPAPNTSPALRNT